MKYSIIINYIHKVIRVLTLLMLLSLYTPLYKVGLLFISILFLLQVVFEGCILNMLEQFFLEREDSNYVLNTKGLIASKFSETRSVQLSISLGIFLSTLIAFKLL